MNFQFPEKLDAIGSMLKLKKLLEALKRGYRTRECGFVGLIRLLSIVVGNGSTHYIQLIQTISKDQHARG